MHPSSNDGYLHTLPPQERHVYAEIDERTVSKQKTNLAYCSLLLIVTLNMRSC